jgi:hypothetical protein
MSYPINFPTPQNANVQIFTQAGSTSDWVKPQGCSFVYFFLIGAGGNGFNGSTISAGRGGGSGSITRFLCPSFLIPDVLRVRVGVGGEGTGASTGTLVIYQQKDTTGYTLLSAPNGAAATSGAGGLGGTAFTGSPFSAMGFLSASSGTIGGSLSITVTATTIISGGSAGGNSGSAAGSNVAPVFGYPDVVGGRAEPISGNGGTGNRGININSNIFVSCGGAGGGGSANNNGGIGGSGSIGSGGGGGGIGSLSGGTAGRGGNGYAVIISW